MEGARRSQKTRTTAEKVREQSEKQGMERIDDVAIVESRYTAGGR